MTKLRLLPLLLLATFQLCAQRAVFLEAGGSGGIASLNYEQTFYKRANADFLWRAGLSFAPIDRNNGTGIVIPVLAEMITGRSAHHLELGLGQGITLTTKGKFFALTTVVAGYRWQKEEKPLFFRVSYTPLVSYLVDLQYQNWGGISIGCTFKGERK
jgi:hypothetical protein